MGLNVLHAPVQWGVGGTEKAAELFVRHHSNEVNVYSVGLHRGGPRAESLRADGYDVYLPDHVDDLASYMAEHDIDIVHSHSGDAEMISEAADRADVPLVVRTDQFGEYFQPDAGHGIDYFFYPSKTILLRTILLNDLDLEGAWSREMGYLYNPLDISTVSDGRSVRDQYDIPESAPVVGKIGRPVPEKWGKLTVKSFDRVVDHVPDARMFLVGAPEKIEKTIAGYGWESQVTYVDTLPPDEVSDFYATIDVLAHTSAIGESYGYVIAEAMANGVPPIADSTPMRDNAQVELIEHGRSGYVANSPAAYGDAIADLLRDDRTRAQFGEAAEERVKEFDIERVVVRLEEFYSRLAADEGLIDAPGTGNEHYARQAEEIRAFAHEYRERVQAEFGSSDRPHAYERRAWRAVESLPAGRKPTYELLRKGFIFVNEYLF